MGSKPTHNISTELRRDLRANSANHKSRNHTVNSIYQGGTPTVGMSAKHFPKMNSRFSSTLRNHLYKHEKNGEIFGGNPLTNF